MVVLGLPRGGVPVALEVAQALSAPLDVIVVRKLGVPFQPELGMGAVGEDGVRVINHEVVRLARVPANEVAAVQAREQAQVEARAARYRARRPREPLAGRVAVIVDGLAVRAWAASPGRRGSQPPSRIHAPAVPGETSAGLSTRAGTSGTSSPPAVSRPSGCWLRRGCAPWLRTPAAVVGQVRCRAGPGAEGEGGRTGPQRPAVVRAATGSDADGAPGGIRAARVAW